MSPPARLAVASASAVNVVPDNVCKYNGAYGTPEMIGALVNVPVQFALAGTACVAVHELPAAEMVHVIAALHGSALEDEHVGARFVAPQFVNAELLFVQTGFDATAPLNDNPLGLHDP